APKIAPTGILVLDDCDPQYQGKSEYGDNLTFIDATGKIGFRKSGFNSSESIGSNHTIAVDTRRDCFWVVENEACRIQKFDRKGTAQFVIKDVPASALAVDPATGNLWMLLSRATARGHGTAVYSASGKQLATYPTSGEDIIHDPKSGSFWIAGGNLT